MDPVDPNKKEAPSVDVTAIVKTVTETVSNAFKSQIEELSKNQKILADTLAAQAPAKDPTKDVGKDGGKDAGKDAAAPLTAEAVAQIVAKTLADKEAAAAEQAAKKGDREKIVSKLVAEKLGGDADLAKFLPADGDEAALTAAADAVAGKIKTFKPDFGNASKDGGENPTSGKTPVKQIPGLSEPLSNYANSLKMPA